MVTLLGASLFIVPAGAEGKAKAGPKHHLAALFRKLDTNHDGLLSLDEFKKMADLGKGKLKNKPKHLEKLFQRLDTNQDGSLSLQEFRHLAELRGKPGARPAGKGIKAQG
jgi:Ca2+-binding EF-hand superfamily protein